ncbi:hypothetical protein HYPSUDRAFT_201443 [Hypholoma sublateritium FD-334 SS-4]|uniref:MSP domain-containing protein n=1 Tax=Hypholoma sublateritium (strain FD-334 SS-4) TaxID=945553 RepID=A0A0D2P3Z8_HYPSF|nr:hypothetical protein HYPSUDRAFT_201443 [Hypholoma sublateritium FD-334 SS-4]
MSSNSATRITDAPSPSLLQVYPNQLKHLPKVEMESPPTETARNTKNMPQAPTLCEVQVKPPWEIVLQVDCTSQTALPASGEHGLRGLDYCPDGILYFQRTSSMSTSGLLRVMNAGEYPVTFKLKTARSPSYYAHPKSGRIESGRSMVVNIEGVPLPEEPSLDRIRTHKFSVEISAIVPERDNLSPVKDAVYVSRPSREVVEERARGSSGREVCQVPSGIIRTDFYAADRLRFHGPLTGPMSRLLIIKNTSSYPIAFKLETTLPELYFARPNSGRVEPDQIIQTTIQCKPFLGQPMFDKECKPKFRVEFATVARGQEKFAVMEALQIAEESKIAKVYTIRDTHAPHDGMMPEELAEYPTNAVLPALEAQVQPPANAEENTRDTARLQVEAMHSASKVHRATYTAHIKVINNLKPQSPPNKVQAQDDEPRVEKMPFAVEPPQNEECGDQFLVEITAVTPVRVDSRVSADDVYESPAENDPSQFYKFGVNYLPKEGLTPEELAEYEAGMAHAIPEELFSVYPSSYLCFKRPLRNPLNLMGHVALANMCTRPIAFMTLLTAPNAQMYTVMPADARIEPGECLEIQVLRVPVDVEPSVQETYPDAFSFLCTVIHPEQDSLGLSDVWAAATSNKRAISQKKLPVLFIPQGDLTPEEELIRARKGLFDRLRDMEALEEVGKLSMLGKDEIDEGDAYPEQLDDAQKALIRQWSLSVVPFKEELCRCTAAGLGNDGEESNARSSDLCSAEEEGEGRRRLAGGAGASGARSESLGTGRSWRKGHDSVDMDHSAQRTEEVPAPSLVLRKPCAETGQCICADHCRRRCKWSTEQHEPACPTFGYVDALWDTGDLLRITIWCPGRRHRLFANCTHVNTHNTDHPHQYGDLEGLSSASYELLCSKSAVAVPPPPSPSPPLSSPSAAHCLWSVSLYAFSSGSASHPGPLVTASAGKALGLSTKKILSFGAIEFLLHPSR